MDSSSNNNEQLTILLVTYNHEIFISKALDSMLNQDFDGSIQVIVADDASSDNTISIIKNYEGRDSRFRFTYLDNTNKLGITKNYQRGFAACSGEYVAVLEGDDYWVSPFKLQRQIDFLDAHYECDLCAVNYFIFDENKMHFYPRTSVGNGYRLISARDLIVDNIVGNFSTCMYRKTSLVALPKKLFDITSYDWIVNICVARTSLISFLEEPMSVYRTHSNGVWAQQSDIEKWEKQLALISDYDKLTNGIFHESFQNLSKQLQHTIKVKNLENSYNKIARPDMKLISRLIQYLPPVILILARVLIPPKLKYLLLKLLKRDAV
jgi:glycosyltransferase involved in cell wall biosynthesis